MAEVAAAADAGGGDGKTVNRQVSKKMLQQQEQDGTKTKGKRKKKKKQIGVDPSSSLLAAAASTACPEPVSWPVGRPGRGAKDGVRIGRKTTTCKAACGVQVLLLLLLLVAPLLLDSLAEVGLWSSALKGRRRRRMW